MTGTQLLLVIAIPSALVVLLLLACAAGFRRIAARLDSIEDGLRRFWESRPR